LKILNRIKFISRSTTV